MPGWKFNPSTVTWFTPKEVTPGQTPDLVYAFPLPYVFQVDGALPRLIVVQIAPESHRYSAPWTANVPPVAENGFVALDKLHPELELSRLYAQTLGDISGWPVEFDLLQERRLHIPERSFDLALPLRIAR